MAVSLIAIGLALVAAFVGYMVVSSRAEANREQRRLLQVWGRENDRPPPWDQPVPFDDTGPDWRKAQFATLMGRLTLIKTNDNDDYLNRRDYFRDMETGQLWLLTTEEPNMSQFLRLTPIDTIPEKL